MKLYRLSLSFLILICLYPDMTYALFASEYATFESFYKESSSIDWTNLTITGALAILFGSLIFFTGGTASPIVASIGTWVGGLKGLSGAAATKWGLAWLGGGSVASGGFGIVGGTVLLTASLTFGTEVTLDYTLSKAVIEYQYNNLVKHSEKMPTLPSPVNSSGSDAYEGAIKILKDIDKKLPMASNSNQRLVAQAISKIETDEESLSENEKIKNKSLLSLLYFMSNRYKEARGHAQTAIEYAQDSKIKSTLPAFIYAISSLYEKEFDFTQITNNYFCYAILEEPENPLIPLLFLIYLDRMLLRFHDDFLDETALDHIFTIMEASKLEKWRMQNYQILLLRYFMRLKLEQQKITALAGTQNSTIKNSPKTLRAVNDSFDSYRALLSSAKAILTHLKLEQEKIKDGSYKALLRGVKNIMRDKLNLDLDDDDSGVPIEYFYRSWSKYDKDSEKLASRVDDLRARVMETRSAEKGGVATAIGLAILAILGVFVWRLIRP